MGERDAKNALYDGLAVVAKALGSGRRAEIVDLLAQGDRSVEEIARQIEQSVANTSQHLRNLAQAGLVRSRREGNRVHYGLASRSVGELWVVLRDVAAEQVAEVERRAVAYLGERDDLQLVSRRDLAARLRKGTVTVLDVRPPEEYAAGHIKGALSIPVEQLSEYPTIENLPKGHEVVAYCRGPYCIYADDAVRMLRAHGVPALRLEDGFPEWVAAGLPTARGPR